MNKILLLLCFLLKGLDVITTGYAVNVVGLEAEKNIVIRNAMEYYGPLMTLILIMILNSLLVYSLYKKQRRRSLIFVTTLLLSVVANNIYWIITKVLMTQIGSA